jgi:hypothetical protein
VERKWLTVDRVSTVRSAIELKQVFDKLQAAESAGLSAEQMRKLEEQAAEQGMRTLWKVILISSRIAPNTRFGKS